MAQYKILKHDCSIICGNQSKEMSIIINKTYIRAVKKYFITPWTDKRIFNTIFNGKDVVSINKTWSTLHFEPESPNTAKKNYPRIDGTIFKVYWFHIRQLYWVKKTLISSQQHFRWTFAYGKSCLREGSRVCKPLTTRMNINGKSHSYYVLVCLWCDLKESLE